MSIVGCRASPGCPAKNSDSKGCALRAPNYIYQGVIRTLIIIEGLSFYTSLIFTSFSKKAGKSAYTSSYKLQSVVYENTSTILYVGTSHRNSTFARIVGAVRMRLRSNSAFEKM